MTSSDRGAGVYDVDEVRAAYLQHRHGGTRSPNVVMEEPAFVAALGDVTGRRVVDLGCGDGATVDLVLGAGAASYLGIDASVGMIEVARARPLDGDVRFEVAAIEDIALERGSVDLVVSRMALHYVANLGPVLGRTHDALTVGGRLVVSVVHPVITAPRSPDDGPRSSWTIDDYFDRGPRRRDWFGAEVVWHHRTVEDLVGVVTAAGFRIDALGECEPDEHLLSDAPDELARRRRVPLVLLLAATRH